MKSIITNPLEPTIIYYETAALDYSRTQEIFDRFPKAKLFEVDAHNEIDELYKEESNVSEWNKIKSNVLVLGVKKAIQARPNCRSTDFIAPSLANGCSLACSYCYVARRKGYANPITTFVNFERIAKYLRGHLPRWEKKLGPKHTQGADALQTDPVNYTYDIGENCDCSVDALISDNLKDTIALFRDEMPGGKASFATKFVNRDLLNYDPQRSTRIRFSLMPAHVARVVDVRTSKVEDRIVAIPDFWEAGYEVHLNFSPVILYEGWEKDYIDLFKHIDDVVSSHPHVKDIRKQLKCEVIMLTHNEKLHQVNMGWHPKAEEKYLWRYKDNEDGTNKFGLSVLQQRKLSQNGMVNLRYKNNHKKSACETFKKLIAEHLPYCDVRYIF